MAEILTPADVRRIATLARLELTAQEIEMFAGQLTAILSYADQVQQVDTSDVAELPNLESRKSDSAFPDSAMSHSRNDDPAPSLARDIVLDQAPEEDSRAGVFKVPRVLGS